MERTDPAEFRRLVRTVREQTESVGDFITRITPRFQSPTHLAPLVSLLDRARLGERVRAFVFAPPRHGKSETILHHAAQWVVTRPTETVAYVTYGATFAETQSVRARAYADAAGFKAHPKIDTKAEWRNEQLGGFIALGFDGPAMGRGFHMLYVDDPHKNRIEAESPRRRASVIEQFKGTLLQRMEPNGSIIATHQRWHDEDLGGTLKDDGGWEIVELPAINSNGAPLWPERYDLRALADLRRSNEYNWWSQYMGSPRPRGGAVFKREPPRFDDLRSDGRPGRGKDGRRIVLAVDAAGTESTRADYTVGIALAVEGRGTSMTANIVDMVRVQLEPPDAAKVLRDFQKRNGGGTLHIEASRDGKQIARMLATIDRSIKVEEVQPVGEKFIRAQGLASAWNDEPCRVSLPEDVTTAPWVVDLLAEFRLFTGTGDKHDDIVDACAHAWNVASQMGSPASASNSSPLDLY